MAEMMRMIDSEKYLSVHSKSFYIIIEFPFRMIAVYFSLETRDRPTLYIYNIL